MITYTDYQLLDNLNFDILTIVEQLHKHIIFKYKKRVESNSISDDIVFMRECTSTGELLFVPYEFVCSYYGDTYLHRISLDILAYLINYYPLEFDIANRLVNNVVQKRKRAKKFITNMVNNGALFVTMTFTDNVLDNTSFSTRRTYIRRFLSSFGTNALANIDFGGKFGREHYHAVLELDSIDFSLYKYGNIDVEKIVQVNSDTKILRYITKLTNHVFKDSTCSFNNSLIYIRKK